MLKRNKNMSTIKNKEDYDMAKYHYDIATSTSYGAVAMLKVLLSAPGVKPVKARVNTTGNPPAYDQASEDWALIIECTSEEGEAREFEIRIFMLTSGYGGSGPHDLLKCLRLCKFKDIDESEIFSVGALKREYHV